MPTSCERRRHALHETLEDRTTVGVAVAPIAAHERPEPRQVLDAERAVEPHAHAAAARCPRVERSGCRGRALSGPPGAAWISANTMHRDDEQQRDGLGEPASSEPHHDPVMKAASRASGRSRDHGFDHGFHHGVGAANVPFVHVPERPALVGLPLKFCRVAGTASILAVL